MCLENWIIGHNTEIYKISDILVIYVSADHIANTMLINLLLLQPPLFSFQASHQILEPGCNDLPLFSHMNISEVQNQCWVIKSGFQLVSSSFQRHWFGKVEIKALRRPVQFLPKQNLEKAFLSCAGFVPLYARAYTFSLLELWKRGKTFPHTVFQIFISFSFLHSVNTLTSTLIFLFLTC